jgi:WD40 repeat protein
LAEDQVSRDKRLIAKVGDVAKVQLEVDGHKVGLEGDIVPGLAVQLAGQARALSMSPAASGFVVAATATQLAVYSAGVEVASLEAAYGPKCVHIARAAVDGSLLVAVGGEDNLVHFYNMHAASGALTEAGANKTALNSAVNSVAISPDGSKVAAGDSTKEVKLIDTSGERGNLVSGRWTKHATKPVALDWNADGSVLASVAADRRMAFWTPSKTTTALESRDLAHFQPFVGLVWAGEKQAVWAVGSDGTIIRYDAPTA